MPQLFISYKNLVGDLQMDSWSSNITQIKGIGRARALQLANLGINTIGQALEYYPRRYEDRTSLKTIESLVEGENETFCATVVTINEKKIRTNLTITNVLVRDASGPASLIWFNKSFIKKTLKPGMHLTIFGKVKYYNHVIQIQNPDIEAIDPDNDTPNLPKIIPVYSTNEKLSQRILRTMIRTCLDICEISEVLPAKIIEQYQLMPKAEAIHNIHFPQSLTLIKQARYRLAFEELFFLQCGLFFIKNKNKMNYSGIKHGTDEALTTCLEKSLPFSLTNDQLLALRDIKTDMEDTIPMQRLIQGDVGSGKTVIAAIALAKTVENGYQGAMMAPTEILAEQHYNTLLQLFTPLGIRLKLLTGKLTKQERQKVLSAMKNGFVDVVIGTHALIQEDVQFKCLGLVVTDEQHRFGVDQRAALKNKGKTPDVLVMTATPIPRTLALTVYGDLDVSSIRQLPPQRKTIKTYFVTNDYRNRVYKNLVLDQIAQGHQAYIVCPLIEDSEKIDAQSAIQLYNELADTYFRNISCALLHGKMKPQEKDKIMNDFASGKIKVLIATTVIEVGVNVPNATVMVVENAERFGLSQLHQLRGRIGRGAYQSFCVLLSDSKNNETQERLMIMAKIHDGFDLAEKDLLLRGPGQFFGTRQHGMPDLKIANIINDVDILLKARQAAQETINTRPNLEGIRSMLTSRFGSYFGMIFND